MKLLFVGKTTFEYNRDLILLNGLKQREDIAVDVFKIEHRSLSTFKKIRKLSKGVDFVVVPSFRHKDVAYIKLASKVPVVFDPLISKYMTRVLDYGVKWKGPHKYLVDWLAFFWPDILIWDTMSHQEYLKKKYKLKKPMAPIYIGADTSLFFPIDKAQTDKTIVGFYGSFNPLQGIDKIVEAANLLKDYDNIQFRIIGTGSTYKNVRKKAADLKITNIEFLPDVPFQDLNQAINEFDICLGVFGDSYKTDVVIPNKVFHYAATKKCIITKNTIGIKELFTPDQNICLVDNTPEEMSKAILALANNIEKRSNLANAAYTLISQKYNQDKIAEMFVNFLRTCS